MTVDSFQPEPINPTSYCHCTEGQWGKTEALSASAVPEGRMVLLVCSLRVFRSISTGLDSATSASSADGGVTFQTERREPTPVRKGGTRS